jgi:ATP-binding cassette subfamily A (ABC1) protein 3
MIQEDTDVATERARLANTPVEDLFTSDSLIIKEVTKYYDNNLAVDHSSVGISQGECFGLLGVNGAGKTTTFKILTGDEVMSSGDAYLDGVSVTENITKVRHTMFSTDRR